MKPGQQPALINFACGLQADLDAISGRAVIQTKQGTELATVFRKRNAWWFENDVNNQSFASLDEVAQTLYESLGKEKSLAFAVEGGIL